MCHPWLYPRQSCWLDISGEPYSCLQIIRQLTNKLGLCMDIMMFYAIEGSFDFYPRPLLASGYCRCLFPSVLHQVCSHDNSSLIQARLTKFGPKMQNILFQVPIVLGGNRLWPSRSNLTWKSKFTRFWACPHHNSTPFKLGSPNLDQMCKIHWLRSLSFWGAIDLDLQGQIWLKKSIFLASLLLEIHNHHITTREPWVPGLLHRPVSWSPCMHLYT